jgi:hypothetical protein
MHVLPANRAGSAQYVPAAIRAESAIDSGTNICN